MPAAKSRLTSQWGIDVTEESSCYCCRDYQFQSSARLHDDLGGGRSSDLPERRVFLRVLQLGPVHGK